MTASYFEAELRDMNFKVSMRDAVFVQVLEHVDYLGDIEAFLWAIHASDIDVEKLKELSSPTKLQQKIQLFAVLEGRLQLDYSGVLNFSENFLLNVGLILSALLLEFPLEDLFEGKLLALSSR